MVDPYSNLSVLEGKMDTLIQAVEGLTERQRRQEELLTEAAPIAREMMSAAITELEEWRQRGVFEFASGLGGIASRVVQHYTPQDVEELGGAIVSILDTVRNMTQPGVLAVINEAGDAIEASDELPPVGILGLARASGDQEVQKGMAVLLEVLRHVGRAARKLEGAQSPPTSKPPSRLDRIRAARASQPGPSLASSVGSPGSGSALATVVDGIGLTPDGFLVDSHQWTKELGERIAAEQKISLTEAHWKVLEAAREEFVTTGASPNIRRLTLVAGVTTRDLYTLFPKAPGKTVARIAGIPKPMGCI